MKSEIYSIAILGGDGIGPDVVAEAVKCLRILEEVVPGARFECCPHPAGAGEFLRSGTPLPDTTLEACAKADATLLGAMGLPGVRWPSGTEMTPQLDIREQLDLYAGLRPLFLYHEKHSPLRGYSAGEIDMVLFRENTEGLFASRKNAADLQASEARDTLLVTRHAAERICRRALEMAQTRRRLCTLVDKANVLPSMAFFRSVFDGVASDFPDVRTERVYVDAAALYLVQNPRRFDVLVMENMFGDILSDLGAGIIGGMGMAPSGDIGDEHAVFQPSHGSAPDIAGKGIANPIATILSAALMLEWLDSEATRTQAVLLRRAVQQVLAEETNATVDLGGQLSTIQMGDKVLRGIREAAQERTAVV